MQQNQELIKEIIQ